MCQNKIVYINHRSYVGGQKIIYKGENTKMKGTLKSRVDTWKNKKMPHFMPYLMYDNFAQNYCLRSLFTYVFYLNFVFIKGYKEVRGMFVRSIRMHNITT
jgi:hypothetical protein